MEKKIYFAYISLIGGKPNKIFSIDLSCGKKILFCDKMIFHRMTKLESENWDVTLGAPYFWTWISSTQSGHSLNC